MISVSLAWLASPFHFFIIVFLCFAPRIDIFHHFLEFSYIWMWVKWCYKWGILCILFAFNLCIICAIMNYTMLAKFLGKKPVFSLYLFQTLIMISSSSSAHIFKDSKLNCTRCIFLLFVNVVPILLLAFFIVFFTWKDENLLSSQSICAMPFVYS